MKTQVTFYHAGCPVCVAAEHTIANALDPQQYQVNIIHLGEQKSRLKDAKAAGVTSVPALVMEGGVFHINYGASLQDLE